MNKTEFKRIFIGASILVGIWMLHLSFQYGEAQDRIERQNSSAAETREITNYEFETPVTRAYESAKESVVSVLNYKTADDKKHNSYGSGVIYSATDDGLYIVTNHHILEPGLIHNVRFWDGSELQATFIGSDKYSNLAVLYVEGDFEYQIIKHANSDEVKSGDYVLALGTPHDLSFVNSASFGVVSGSNRVIAVDTDGDGRVDWNMRTLQSDASISNGSSGGPLVDMDGALIAINTLRISKEAVEGMGFAIPINDVHAVVDTLIKDGSIQYPSLGITVQSIEDLSLYNRLQRKIPDSIEEGILVIDVENDKSASKAGILSNDIILGINSVSTPNFRLFRVELFKSKIGDTIEVDLYRDGSIRTIKVVLE